VSSTLDSHEPSNFAFTVILHIPFLTQAVLRPEARTAVTPQELGELIEAMNAAAGAAGRPHVWRLPGTEGLQLEGDETQGAGETDLQQYSAGLNVEIRRALPHRLASRQVRDGSPGPETWLPEDFEHKGDRWRFVAGDVDLWDSGVGLLSARYDLAPARGANWAEMEKRIDDARNGIRDSAATALREIADQFASDAAVAEKTERESASSSDGPRGDPLWTHNLLAVEVEATVPAAVYEEMCAILTNGGIAVPLPERSEPASHVRIGLNACVACPPPRLRLVTSVARLVAVHTTIWAAATGLDLALSRELRLPGGEWRESLPDMESRAANVLALYERVQGFSFGLRDIAADLDDLDRVLWEAIAQKWGLEGRLDALEVKLSRLDHILSHSTAALTARRARRLDQLVVIFTVAGVVTSAAALADFLTKDLKGVSVLNGVLASVFVLAAVLIYVLVRPWLSGRR
jgi:hypothetical protein